MTSPSQNLTSGLYHEPAAAALEALAVFVAAAAAFFAIGAALGPGLGTLAAAQLGGLGGVSVGWALWRGRPAVRLGLRAPPVRAVAGAALIGLSGWYLNLRLAEPIARLVDHGELAHLAQVFGGGPSLATQLLVVALVPALCEELAARAVLTRGLRPAVGRTLACLLSALAFASFHLSLVRLVPTFLLGVVLAALTLAADSIWPAVLVHFLNNAMVVLLIDGQLGGLGRALAAHPAAALVCGIAIFAGGLVVGLTARRRL
jgi:membrane protease YdiL (CAAX protease family)